MTLGTLWQTSVTLTKWGLRLRQVKSADQHHRANAQQIWDWSILGTEASAALMGSRATSHVRVFKRFIDIEFIPCRITLV